jgi:hypothetical protein
VHFHLLIRLDAARPPAVERLGVPWRLPYRITPPPEGYTVELLAQALRNAVAHTQVPYPEQLLDDTWSDQACAGDGSSQGLDGCQGPKAFPQGKWRQSPLTPAQPARLEARDRAPDPLPSQRSSPRQPTATGLNAVSCPT